MKKITFRVITILVVVSVAIFACSCVKKTGSFNPIYSSGYKSFESLQKEYENKKSKFSKRARELHDAIAPGVADIDYSKTLDGLDSFYACFGMNIESLTEEYFALLYKKDVTELTPQEVREVNLYVRNANTDIRMKDPFFIKLSSYYGFDNPKDFYRFGEYLMDYIPYSEEAHEIIGFSLDELYEMYQNNNMVFPDTNTPIEEKVFREMNTMPKVLNKKSSGFTFDEAVEIQAWMRNMNSLVRSFIPQVRTAMDENGLAISFDSLSSRIMAQYVREKLVQ